MNNSTWLIDTGAMDHVIFSLNALTTYKSIQNTFVNFPNWQRAKVSHIGPKMLEDDKTC